MATRTTCLAIAALGACLSLPPRPMFDEAAIQSACMDQAVAVCALRSSCSFNDYNPDVLYGSDDVCVARQTLTCVTNLDVADTAQTPEHVEACAQSYPAFSCSAYFDGAIPDRCVVTGPGAVGTVCETNPQCASDFCAVADHQTCGTCQPQPVAGAPCMVRSECGHDLLCAIPLGMTSGSCVVAANDNTACLTGVLPCIATEVCQDDDEASGTMGVCHPGVRDMTTACNNTRKGAPSCDSTYGLFCTTSSTTIPGTCMPIVLVGPGATCGTIGANGARINYGCSASGLCVKSPVTASTGLCVAAAADGAACNTDATIGPPCFSPAVCVVSGDGTAGVCTIPDPAACF